MSWPGGPSKPKIPPPAGSKKGLGPGTRSARTGFARRCSEEERADTLFRPQATTNKAAARRETAASGSEQSNTARAARPKRCGQKHQSAGWSEVVVTRGRVLMWLRGNDFLEPCAAGD